MSHPASIFILMNPTRKNLDRLLADYRHAKSRVKEEKAFLTLAKEKVSCAEQAQEIVQRVAEAVQRKAHERIASVVTRCLEAIFGEDAYQFEIHFEKKRGKTEAKLVFVKDGLVLEDPANESGGGAVDVAAFALRLSCLLLSIPRKRLLLVVDEPFKHINGEEYQERVGSLLTTLAEEMNLQIIIVSDDPWLKVGKVIDLG